MRSGTGVQTPAEGIYSTGKIGGRHVGARGAAAAYMTNGTAVTGVHAASVRNGLTGMIDVLQRLILQISDERGKFSAAVDLAVGQEGYAVKGYRAAMSCTSTGQGLSLLVAHETQEIFLEGNNLAAHGLGI